MNKLEKFEKDGRALIMTGLHVRSLTDLIYIKRGTVLKVLEVTNTYGLVSIEIPNSNNESIVLSPSFLEPATKLTKLLYGD